MYEFLKRLIAVALPRIRDFRGISARGFDGSGNFNFGVTEQIIFPEIEYETVDAVRGMKITITPTAKNDEQGKAQSGRASSRARVCQYVYISVGAVSLKKTTMKSEE